MGIVDQCERDLEVRVHSERCSLRRSEIRGFVDTRPVEDLIAEGDRAEELIKEGLKIRAARQEMISRQIAEAFDLWQFKTLDKTDSFPPIGSIESNFIRQYCAEAPTTRSVPDFFGGSHAQHVLVNDLLSRGFRIRLWPEMAERAGMRLLVWFSEIRAPLSPRAHTGEALDSGAAIIDALDEFMISGVRIPERRQNDNGGHKQQYSTGCSRP